MGYGWEILAVSLSAKFMVSISPTAQDNPAVAQDRRIAPSG